ncbi:MAG: response regulator receiver protein [Chloroflexota bacterium]
MFNTNWPVLIVDDEPDVLQISKMAMRGFSVFGLPIELHTAASKTEAIEVMRGLVPLAPVLPRPRVAVAFIDVVMESDTAGLELCDYIRNTIRNKTMQIFIRTGQPAIAPEREVIDNYDINGYFTKAEATEDKLYSLVKSGCRQYLSFATAQAASMLSATISAADSRPTLATFFRAAPLLKREGHFVLIDGQAIAGSLSEVEARDLAKRLEQLPGHPFGVDGSKFVAENDTMLFKIAADTTKSEVIHVVKGDWHFMPPEVVRHFLLSTWTTVAARWKQMG